MTLNLLRTRRIAAASAASLSALALGVGLAGPANADTVAGWVGGTPPINGTVYLHQSSITNAPTLHADSTVYTSFGTLVAPQTLGVQPRLFKSGALCALGGWTYNIQPTATFSGTIAGDCGTGSYNSNGFVRVRDGNAFDEYVTFPTNAVNWTSPATTPAARAAVAANPAAGTNAAGQTYGSASTAKTPAAVPDLVLTIASNGKVGYTRKTDLDKPHSSTITVYANNGTTPIGTLAAR